MGANLEEWRSFERQWKMYKSGTSIPDVQTQTALFHCCKRDLREDILRDIHIDVATMPESELIAEIKRLAVKEESTLVHRMKLGKMVQAPGSSIRTFLANLRGQAALCNFTVSCKEEGCTHTFDYSSEIIKDHLVRGIADPEILADLLGDPKTDRSLDEVVAFVAQKEQGKATRMAVGDSTGAMSMQNAFVYQKEQGRATRMAVGDRTDTLTTQNAAKIQQSKCWACGGSSHGLKNDRNTRSRRCPAWSATCDKCRVKGHFSKSCSRCSACGNWGHRDSSSRFCIKNKTGAQAYHLKDIEEEQLCAHNDEAIAHHVFEDKWVARPSKPHPTVSAHLLPAPEDHKFLGHPITPDRPLRGVTVPMIADSGCQSSIIPLQTALAMGYREEDLMPVKMKMRGAITENLEVEGGIAAQVSVNDTEGTPRLTRQVLYVSRRIEKAFLCREALEQLGILPPRFPDIPPEGLLSTEECHCPNRDQGVPPIPTVLPPNMKATQEDVPRLKQWLLDYYGATTFNTCEHQPLPMMQCEPLKLHVDPRAKPVAVHKPAVVPIHWQEKVHRDLERDVRLGVLEKVSPNTPVTWCSRMVVTAKTDGSPRRTVDLQPQNRHSVRQTHHTSSPFRLAEQIKQGTKKTVTDAWNGYHAVPLCEEDRHITTFITPWGRYRYKVAPQGFLASGDGYTQRFDAIIADFPNKVKCVDDTCMWADSIEEAFFQTCQWLDLCARNGITLNPKKFQFAQDVVDFAGLSVTTDSIKPSQRFLDSVLEFPTPKDITGARAWFGLVNQGAYAFSVAKEMKPFRHLLKPGNIFKWDEELDRVFLRSKQIIVQSIKDGVRLFDPARPTCLSTDWSNDGIGFMLKQKYCSCTPITPSCCPSGWRLALVGSRFTTPAESRYAPIEGEALAVAYALHQARYYVLGCPHLIVATDHKPLVNILNDKSMTDISNRRLLNLKQKTLAYRFDIHHISGAKNKGPDAMSRYPVSRESPEGEHDLAENDSVLAAATTTLYAASNIVTWEMVRSATAKDTTLQSLMTHIQAGMPGIQSLPQDIRPYHRYGAQLYLIDGVVMIGQRIVIPTTLRHQILSALHAAHQGVGVMCQRAANSVFWPGISVDITRTRNECKECHRIAKSNAMEPPMDITPSEYPFHKICADYFQHNSQNYLVIVDRYSGWPVVFKESGRAEGLVKRLREVFMTFGIPEELTTDGGPQFTAEQTRQFLASWGVQHRLTSVGNPHANNRAEVAVKTVKRLLMANTGPTGSLDVDAFQKAILAYRNSIDPETRTSPSMIVFGRPIRDLIPTPLGKYCPHQTWQETLEFREKAMAKRHFREKEKWSAGTRSLAPLALGDHVYIQNLAGNQPLRWERTGIVVECKPFQQYLVKTDGTGRATLRNRRNLRKFTPFRPLSNDMPQIEVISPQVWTSKREIEDATVPRSRPTTGLQPTHKDPLTSAQQRPGTITPQAPEPTSPQAPKSVEPQAPEPILHQDPEPTAPQTPKSAEPQVLEPILHQDPGLPAPELVSQPDNRTRPAKVPLALRRLLPFNKAGKLE